MWAGCIRRIIDIDLSVFSEDGKQETLGFLKMNRKSPRFLVSVRLFGSVADDAPVVADRHEISCVDAYECFT